MSELFWIGRSLNLELTRLEDELRIVYRLEPESIARAVYDLRAIAALLTGGPALPLPVFGARTATPKGE